MKFNIKKLPILGLVGIFLLSAMMCCCFTNVVEAEELTPSCHQTEHKTDSSQNTEECGCDLSLAIIKKDVALNDTLVAVATFVIEQQTGNQFTISSFIVANQAPPQFYDTSPLYIKYSILRI